MCYFAAADQLLRSGAQPQKVGGGWEHVWTNSNPNRDRIEQLHPAPLPHRHILLFRDARAFTSPQVGGCFCSSNFKTLKLLHYQREMTLRRGWLLRLLGSRENQRRRWSLTNHKLQPRELEKISPFRYKKTCSMNLSSSILFSWCCFLSAYVYPSLEGTKIR